MLRLTDGRGVDVVLDMVAGDYIGARARSAWPKTAASSIIAVQGGTRATIDAGLVLRRRLAITGSTLRPRPVAFKAAIAAGAARARSGRCSKPAASSR